MVSARVAEHRPETQRAQRFAWLGDMSLLGFLFGPTLSAVLSAVAIGLAVLAADCADAWMYLVVSLTSAGTGPVLPVIAYLAAAASPHKPGALMGGLAAASGLGKTRGSAAGGWLFGALAQRSFGGLVLPLLLSQGIVAGSSSPRAAG